MNLGVTMHAMVRYLERKRGQKVKRLCREVRKAGDHAIIAELTENHDLSVTDLAKEMLSKPVVEAYRAGARCIKYNGARFVFGDGKIVTVTPSGVPKARREAKGRR